MPYQHELAVAVEAAQAAGRLLMQHFGRPVHATHKGAIDLVTEMDTASERLIIETLQAAFPDDGVLSEEAPPEQLERPRRWIIDPLDGTTNYAHALPTFAVSIALEVDGALVVGVIEDPVHGETFIATAGGRAFLNGEAVRVSEVAEFAEAFLATGFPYDIHTASVTNLDHFGNFARRALAVRRPGAAAIDLAHTACGRYDAFWELKLKPWDVAAGALLVAEAGGRVSDFTGEPLDIYRPEIVASNGLLHKAMLEVLRLGRRPEEAN
ncbi:MAG: inositol monophosphatase family protein [Nitrospinota bacterium]